MSANARLFLDESRRRFAFALERIEHCLRQLGDGPVWWSPGPGQNAIGTIILHLYGNLGQWMIAGVGGTPDTRIRHEEFIPRPEITKAELHARLRAVVTQIDAILAALPEDELLRERRIQGHDTTGLTAIYKAITHMELHVGQILYLTRMQLGEAYKESWTPRTREEGLPE